MFLGTACTREVRQPTGIPPRADTSTARNYATKQFLADFEAPENSAYLIGEGDRVDITAWGHKDLSGKQLVGPDGRVTLPLVGSLRIANLTREDAASLIRKAFLPYFNKLSITVGIEQYNSNKITVLGRILKPGIHRFDSQLTLLDALAESGSMPIRSSDATAPIPLLSCAVMRGRNRVAWVDLSRLLSGGDLSLNLRLRPNDVVFIPDVNETQIYVLGEVRNPGPYPMTQHMTFLDAIARAGGTTRDAAPWKIRLVRPSTGQDIEINLRKMLPDPARNYRLETGDIVYVPTSVLGKIGYFFQQISPGLFYFSAGQSLGNL